MEKGACFNVLLLLSAIFLFLSGCEAARPPAASEAVEVEAVTTIYPLADIMCRLGGEKVAVSCLLPAGASPHTFEPTAEQVKKGARADIFVYAGGGLDDWAIKIAGAASDRLYLLNLTETAVSQGWIPSQGILEEPFDGAHGGPGPDNPHLWLDPLTVRDFLCPALAGALAEIDPQNESYYRSNLTAYQSELTALDEEIRFSLNSLPRKSFISFHAAWHYFASRYGLNEAAVICDFPGQEPSAAWLSELIGLCEEHRVRVVCAEPQLSAAVAETIAREIGGKVVLLDPLGGEDVARRKSYLELMRYNTAVLKNALSD